MFLNYLFNYNYFAVEATNKMSDQQYPGSKDGSRNIRASKFDQNLYGDSLEYSQTIGETDEREAAIAAKIAAS